MNETWVIILAGGEGKRLASLTRALYGSDVPKQFAILQGDRSLLQRTIERAELITDRARIVVVVTRHHRALARAQLAAYPGVHLVVQPRSLDTGPGMLLPLAYVRARAPSARVVVLPADHHIPKPAPLVEALDRAAHHRDTRRHVTLVGVHAEHPETEYGWIERGDRLAGRAPAAVWSVRRFVEKPPQEVAEALHARGAVWNTFIAAGPVASFWQLAAPRLPQHVRELAAWAPHADRPRGDAHLDTAYARMAPANWSTDVLAATAPSQLALVAAAGTGWSDWGSPRRVFESMAGTDDLHDLMARVSGAAAA